MQTRASLIDRLVARARHLRYKWFARGPTPEQWEARLRRVVAESVARSLPWIPAHGARLVDVGANIGIYTELVLRERPDLEAWLFEPVGSHFEAARARFGSNPRIHVEHLALGDADAPMTIWKPKHNPGGNLLTEELMRRRAGQMDFRPEEVRCRVFTDWARERGIERVDFVKSDTEGFDYRVLRGMFEFLARCEPRPAILAELLAPHVHHDWEAQLEVLERLYALGYERVDLSGMDDVQDFLFVPAGRRPPVRGVRDERGA
jgi:FkbM family methyltransferase